MSKKTPNASSQDETATAAPPSGDDARADEGTLREALGRLHTMGKILADYRSRPKEIPEVRWEELRIATRYAERLLFPAAASPSAGSKEP